MKNEEKTEQNKIEKNLKTIFLVQKKYKCTNITNKQATNKMCTLKNIKNSKQKHTKCKGKKQRTQKLDNETNGTYLQNDILKLNIYGPNSQACTLHMQKKGSTKHKVEMIG